MRTRDERLRVLISHRSLSPHFTALFLSDPEIQQILRDPTISKVLQDMQTSPEIGQA